MFKCFLNKYYVLIFVKNNCSVNFNCISMFLNFATTFFIFIYQQYTLSNKQYTFFFYKCILNCLFSVCILLPCDIDAMLGYMPGDVIGWVEKDGKAGVSSDQEVAHALDQIENGVTVHVSCNNW